MFLQEARQNLRLGGDSHFYTFEIDHKDQLDGRERLLGGMKVGW